MIVMLLAASCVKEQIGQASSDEAVMTLNISLPDDVVTKAYGDGQYDAKNVIIGVFDENGNERFRKVESWEKDVFSKTVNITFLMGKKYQLVLWAQYGNAYGDPNAKAGEANAMDLKTITMKYDASNQENLDAFYAYEPVFEVRADFTKNIILKRPFAQVNFATTVGDIDEAVAAGLEPKATVTVKNAANTLDLFTGKTTYVGADGKAAAEGAAVTVPATEFPKVNGKYPVITVESVNYEVIAMNYFLVADENAADGKTTVNLALKVGEVEIGVPEAPMKRNYRTNVIGELLTGEGTFTVTIDPIFDGTYNENWNDGTSDEDVVTKTSAWTLLGSHNEWKSDSKMLLENGLAVAKNVVFPATKAVGDHQFKLYKSVAGENGAAVETWVGMSAEAVVPADKYVAAVVGTAGKDVNIAAGTYDIWFDEANNKIYVMTPEKAIKEATEFVAETPEDPDQPVKSAWGIVGSMTSWSGTADAPVADIPMYVEGDYQVAKGVAIAADDAFKFRTNNSWGTELTAGLIEPDKAYNVAPGSGNITVSAAGTYDIYLDVVNNKVYMMTEGKTPADAEVAVDYWGVIGTVKDNIWTTDVKMTLEGDWYVAKAVELVVNENDAASEYKIGFKFRKNGAWAEQRSTSEAAPITLDTEYPTVSNGDAGNILISAAGTYDIYLSADLAKFKVSASANTEEPEQPEQPEQPEVTSIADFLNAEVPAEGEEPTWYTLTGKITNIANTTYGNFDLTDETGTVYVYGLTATQVESNDKSFSTLGLRENDVVTLKGTRAVYQGTAQVGGPAYYVSHVAAPYLEVSKTKINVAADATSAEFTVESNVKWTAACPTAEVTVAENKVTVTFAANTSTEAAVEHVVTISSELDPVTVTINQAKVPSGETTAEYVKVTSEPQDWSGQYLIVWDDAAHATLTLTSKDLNKTVDVAIVDDKIAVSDDLAPAVMTVVKNGDAYNMTFADGKYFGMQHNGCKLFDTAFALGFEYTEAGVEISGQASNSGKESTYYLYRNVGSSGTYYRCYVHKNGQSGYTFPTLYKLTE